MKFTTSTLLAFSAAAVVSAIPLNARDTRYNSAIPTSGTSDSDGGLVWAIDAADPITAPSNNNIPSSGSSDDQGPLSWAVLGADPIWATDVAASPVSIAVPTAQNRVKVTSTTARAPTVTSIAGRTSSTTIIKSSVKTTPQVVSTTAKPTTTTKATSLSVTVLTTSTKSANSGSGGGLLGFLGLGGNKSTSPTSTRVSTIQPVTSTRVSTMQPLTISSTRYFTTSTPAATVTIPGRTSTTFSTRYISRTSSAVVSSSSASLAPHTAQAAQAIKAGNAPVVISSASASASPTSIKNNNNNNNNNANQGSVITSYSTTWTTKGATVTLPGHTSYTTIYRQHGTTLTALPKSK